MPSIRLPSKEEIAVAIRGMRIARGFRQRDVIKGAGVTNQHLWNIENGFQLPGLMTLIKLARFYKCTIEELINLDEETK